MEELLILLARMEQAAEARARAAHEQAHQRPPEIVYQDADLIVRRAACGCTAAFIRKGDGLVPGPMRRMAARN